MKYKVSNYLIFTDVLDDSQQVKKRIAYSTRTGKVAIISDRVYNILMSKHFEKIDHHILQLLFDLEVLVPADQNEFENVLEQNIAITEDSDDLSFVIQPTANCQLGCHYCGQSHNKHTLPDNLVPKIMDRISHMATQKQYRSLYIVWFGGEPLLGYSQIKKLSQDFIQLSDENSWRYSSKIVTNGLSLKKNIARELILDCNVTYFQITIDGAKEQHDQRRVTKKTADGTFDIILSNVLNLLELDEFASSGSFLEIRMNIDHTNYESIPELIDLLAERKINEKNVGLSFAPILDWGGNDASKASLSNEMYGECEIEWIMYAASKGFRMNNIVPTRSYAPCMVVNESSEVFDAYGNVYACYEYPITPAYDHPDYKIGNLMMDPSLDNLKATPRNWFEDIKDNISWCPSCTYFPVCGGGCPKEWYSGNPSCPPFKFNGEDRLILQHILNNIENVSELL